MNPNPIGIVSSRNQTGYIYRIINQKPDGFGFRWTVEYGRGFRFEGRIIINSDPRGNLKWEPHRETPHYVQGWPENSEDLQEDLAAEIKRRGNGGWRA